MEQEMSREKQIIEQMAYDICVNRKANFADGCRVCSHHERCIYQDIASALYREDYRKQREGEWIFGKLGGRDAWVCSLCGAGFTGENAEWIAKEHDFCPKCGAHMTYEG